MLPSRAWELLMGSFLAYTNWTPTSQKNKAVCILFGLLLMVMSIVLYGNNSYPGFWAFIPCLGATLYIAGNTNYTFTNKFNLIHMITNNKLLIFIGVISYSLYLWHWVILLFYSYLKEFITETIFIQCTLIVLIFLISALSWKYVEQPVRQRAVFKNRKILWGLTISIILSLVCISSKMRDITYIQSIQYGKLLNYTIANGTNAYHYQENQPVDFIVVGDSHSTPNTNVFEELAQKYHCQGRHAPLFDVANRYRQDKNYSNTVNAIKQFIIDNNIKNVFILMRLSHKYNGKTAYYDENEKGEKFVYAPNPGLAPQEAFLQSLRDTVSLFRDNGVQNIYIQMPLPEPKKHIPRYAFYSRLFFPLTDEEFNAKFQESVEEYHIRCKDVNAALQEIEKEFPEVTLIDSPSVFLNKEKNHFLAIENNTSYYYDDDHLSAEGAALLYPLYENIFMKMQNTSHAK